MTEQEDIRKRKVPCLYIGEHPIRLSPMGRPYFDARGRLLKKLDLVAGDTLMLPEVEVAGMTYWHDPSGVAESELIGVGKAVKAEHADIGEQEVLQALGYEFHDGRPDFLQLDASQIVALSDEEATAPDAPVPPVPPAPSSSSSSSKKAAAAPAAEEVS